ncbi:hypothetical protein ACJX0J_030277, partial [Zea mays]
YVILWHAHTTLSHTTTLMSRREGIGVYSKLMEEVLINYQVQEIFDLTFPSGVTKKPLIYIQPHGMLRQSIRGGDLIRVGGLKIVSVSVMFGHVEVKLDLFDFHVFSTINYTHTQAGSSGGDVFKTTCGWMIIGIEIIEAQKFSFLAYKIAILRKVISENKCCGIILLHLDYIL